MSMQDTNNFGGTKENDILTGKEIDDDTEGKPHVG